MTGKRLGLLCLLLALVALVAWTGVWTSSRRHRAPLPPALTPAFEVPVEPVDAGQNPIRKGRDPDTGWPLEIRHPATGMHLLFIPAGEFRMGSPENEEDRHADEGPVHLVRITRPFYLGKYAVTRAEWRQVLGEVPGPDPGPTYPVEGISWDDGQEFLQRLNQGLRDSRGGEEGGTGDSGPHFGLPTEAQWEYACRAGTTTRFSFGDDPGYGQIGQYAWYINSAETGAHPVGARTPNLWGLYDLHGNVYEWCADWYGRYTAAEAVDPTGPERGTVRVLRGAAGRFKPWNVRSASRFRGAPDFRYFGYGCRLALVVE